MKITTNTQELKTAVDFASQVCGQRSTLAALSHVLISTEGDGIMVSASNLQIHLRHSCPAVVDGEMSLGVPAKILSEWLKTVDGVTTELELINGRLKAKCGSAMSHFSVLANEEFPKYPNGEENGSIHTTEGELRKSISQVRYAIGDGNKGPRYESMAIQFTDSGMLFVATPGNMLARAQHNTQKYPDRTIIVPSLLTSLICGALDPKSESDVNILFNDNRIEVSGSSWEIAGSLVDDKYMEWQKMIPENPRHTIELPRKELIASIKRVRLFSSENFWPIELHFTKTGLKIKNTGGEHQGEDDIVMKCPTIKFAVNPTYLLGTLEAMESDTVTMKCTDSLTALMFEDDNFMALIAPCTVVGN